MTLRFSCPADLHDRGCDIFAVCFTRDQLKKLLDVLANHEDEGPHGKGWQSSLLEEIKNSVSRQAENLTDDTCFNSK